MRQGCIADDVREAYLGCLDRKLRAIESSYTAHRNLYQGMCREQVALEGQLKADAAVCLKRTGALGPIELSHARDSMLRTHWFLGE